MDKSKQEWEAAQRVKNPNVTQQELDTKWKSQNPGWAQSLARGILHPIDAAGSAASTLAERSRASGSKEIAPVKVPDFGFLNEKEPTTQKEPTLAERVNTPEPTKPDPSSPLFNPDNLAKPAEPTATTTQGNSEIINSIVPPPSKTADVTPSQAEKSLRAATQAYNSLKYTAPESTTKELRSKLEEAYNNKITRNDWTELATTLANAVAQYGSAHQAGDKYSGGIKFAPGVDYGARSDRAFKEYSHATDTADKTDAAKERGSLQEYQARMDVLRGKTDLAKLDVDMERDRARTAAASQSELGKMTDREKLAASEAEEERKANRVLNATDQETIDKITKYQNLETQISKTDPKNTKLLNSLIQLQTKLSGGLTPDQEAAAITKAHAGDKSSWMPFMGTEASPADEEKAKREARGGVLQDYQSRIAGRNVLPSTPPAPSGGQASSTGKTPVSRRDLTEYATKYNMSEEAAKQYLQSQGLQVEGN